MSAAVPNGVVDITGILALAYNVDFSIFASALIAGKLVLRPIIASQLYMAASTGFLSQFAICKSVLEILKKLGNASIQNGVSAWVGAVCWGLFFALLGLLWVTRPVREPAEEGDDDDDDAELEEPAAAAKK